MALSPAATTARPAGHGLDFSVSEGRLDTITVFAHRRSPLLEPPDPHAPRHLGPLTVETTETPYGDNRVVTTTTTALPIAGVPGLDAIATVSGVNGANDTIVQAPIAPQGPPAGLRLRF
jgi:hypothetical protein